jgi:CheY-like chemotaxis protein
MGEGSTFRLRVRMSQSPRAESPSPSLQLDGQRILLVVAHPLDRLALQRQLQPQGYHVTVAYSAEEGLAQYWSMLAAGQPPAAAIIDDRLPDRSGVKVGAAIRASASPHTALLLLAPLTACLPDADRRMMDRVLTKPVKAAALLRALIELTVPAVAVPRTHGAAPKGKMFLGMRVLIAEDNAVNQKLVTQMLQNFGAQVQVAGNGIAALEALRGTDFDLVLMDCQMPEMDGFEATKAIRSGSSGFADIPIIALTANALDGEKERCLAAGMDDYLAKPIKAEALGQKLEVWLSRAVAIVA